MGDNEQSSQGSVMTKQIQKQTGKNKPEQKDVNERQLRDREERFCQEIVLGKTHYEAYLNAGYKANNKVTASNLASRLLKNDRIQTRLAVLRAEAAERYKVTPDNIFMRTGAILNADMSNYMTWGPNGVTLKPSSELTPEQSAAVEEITETVTKDGGTVKIKLHSKTKAIELGAKILKMVSDKPEPLGEVTLKIIYDEPKRKPNGD
jgi:phage terminase small subunit